MAGFPWKVGALLRVLEVVRIAVCGVGSFSIFRGVALNPKP